MENWIYRLPSTAYACVDCSRRPSPFIADRKLRWLCIQHLADKFMPQRKITLATKLPDIKLPKKLGK